MVVFNKNQRADVLNLPIILKVAGCLSSICVLHKTKAYNKIKAQAENWLSYSTNINVCHSMKKQQHSFHIHDVAAFCAVEKFYSTNRLFMYFCLWPTASAEDLLTHCQLQAFCSLAPLIPTAAKIFT